MRATSSVTAGFTAIEALLALAIMALVLGSATVANQAIRSALRVQGTATLEGGATVSVSPDESVAGRARLLGLEMLSMAPEFCVCANAPWDPDQAQQTDNLQVLSTLSRNAFADPLRTRNELSSAGLAFSPDMGFTVWFVGHNLAVSGAVTVARRSVRTSTGESLVLYTTRLYGSDGNGYGLLLDYSFASPEGVAQQISTPTYNAGTWTLTLPDPGLATDRPDGTAATAGATAHVYAIYAQL